MTKPIKPSEVAKAKTETIPAAVFEAFNEMIVQNWNGSSSNFTQDSVMNLVMEKLGEAHTRQEVYKKGWLDIEDSYRDEGWKVEYDKPGYNESYSANFTFSKKRGS